MFIPRQKYRKSLSLTVLTSLDCIFHQEGGLLGTLTVEGEGVLLRNRKRACYKRQLQLHWRSHVSHDSDDHPVFSFHVGSRFLLP